MTSDEQKKLDAQKELDAAVDEVTFESADIKDPTFIDLWNKFQVLTDDVNMVIGAIKALGKQILESEKTRGKALDVIKAEMANLNAAFIKYQANTTTPLRYSNESSGAQKRTDYGDVDRFRWQPSKNYKDSWWCFAVRKDDTSIKTLGTEKLQEAIRLNDWKPITINGFNYGLSKPDKDNIRRFISKNKPQEKK